jgi:2'-5' RNA ligase
VTQYAIVAFPDLQQRAQIELVRRRLDPMAEVLDAHVTIVFPFSGSLSKAYIEDHIRERLYGVQPFDFELSQPSPGGGGYVFLNVLRGAASFVDLHDRLYTGILSPFRSQTHKYVPHVTIGCLPDPQVAARAAQVSAELTTAGLRGSVRSLALFRLEGLQTGHVDATFLLGSRRGA